jgi:hypothetical protein
VDDKLAIGDDAPPRSWKRAKWAWRLLQAKRAERKGDYEGGLRLLEEAELIKPLWASERVLRAMLLLRAQRVPEAQSSFSMLRREFEGADDPDLQYLRRFCTAMLGMIRVDAAPMNYEAKQAQTIPCSPRLRQRFPLISSDDD